jgi:hypothetical protein
MARLYIRARMVNAWRRLFPHRAVIAMRERRRVALKATFTENAKVAAQRAAVRSMTERLRAEVRR